MFSRTCVKNSVRWGGGHPGHTPGRQTIPPPTGRQTAPPPQQTATETDGTHPTGMHSFLMYKDATCEVFFLWEILESQWNRLQQFGRNYSINIPIISCLFKKHNSWPIHGKCSFLNNAIHKRNEIL